MLRTRWIVPSCEMPIFWMRRTLTELKRASFDPDLYWWWCQCEPVILDGVQNFESKCSWHFVQNEMSQCWVQTGPIWNFEVCHLSIMSPAFVRAGHLQEHAMQGAKRETISSAPDWLFFCLASLIDSEHTCEQNWIGQACKSWQSLNSLTFVTVGTKDEQWASLAVWPGVVWADWNWVWFSLSSLSLGRGHSHVNRISTVSQRSHDRIGNMRTT